MVCLAAAVWLAVSVDSPLSKSGQLRRRGEAEMARIEHIAAPLRNRTEAGEAIELDRLLADAQRFKSADQVGSLERLTTRLQELSQQVDRREQLTAQLEKAGDEVNELAGRSQPASRKTARREESERLVKLAAASKSSRDIAGLEALVPSLKELQAQAERQRWLATRLAELRAEIDRLAKAVRKVAKEDRVTQEVEACVTRAGAAETAANLDELQHARDAHYRAER